MLILTNTYSINNKIQILRAQHVQRLIPANLNELVYNTLTQQAQRSQVENYTHNLQLTVNINGV